MKVLSDVILPFALGDSKLIIHKFVELENYVLTIQDANSSNIVITIDENKNFQYRKDDNKALELKDVTKKQLYEMGKFLYNLKSASNCL